MDCGMSTSSDVEICKFAETQRWIIVSKDEDFFFLSRRLNSGIRVLWVRLGNCRTANLLAAFEQHWNNIARCFESGDQIVELR